MLLEVSHYSREKERLINETVGKSYSIISRIKMGGIGSQRLAIQSAPSEILDLFSHQSGSSFTNIELRPKGIILWFRSRVDVYVLVLPYHTLSVFKSDGTLSVFSSQWKLKLAPVNNQKLKHPFIEKMIRLKSSFHTDVHDL